MARAALTCARAHSLVLSALAKAGQVRLRRNKERHVAAGPRKPSHKVASFGKSERKNGRPQRGRQRLPTL